MTVAPSATPARTASISLYFGFIRFSSPLVCSLHERAPSTARERRLRNRKPSGDVFPTESFCKARPTQRDNYPGSMLAPTKLYGQGRSESFLLLQRALVDLTGRASEPRLSDAKTRTASLLCSSS